MPQEPAIPNHSVLTPQLSTDRMILEPVNPAQAEEMAIVLADPEVYRFIGGQAPGLETLRARYAQQAKGISPGGDEMWFNWILRRRDLEVAIGYVQAGVPTIGPRVATLAWVVGTRHQGAGYATEAARSVVLWLARACGVIAYTAAVDRDNAPSIRVAEKLGFHPQGHTDDGEVLWKLEDSVR